MSVSDRVLICVPSPVAEVKPTHECDIAINQTQLLVMCPVQDYIAGHAIDPLQGVRTEFGSSSGIQLEPLK